MCAKSRQYSLPALRVYCRFFTYGDLPLEQHLQQIEEEALSKFERTEPNTAVPPQMLWDKPVRYTIHIIIFWPTMKKQISGRILTSSQFLFFSSIHPVHSFL